MRIWGFAEGGLCSNRLSIRSIIAALVVLAAWFMAMAPGLARANTPNVAVSPTAGTPGTGLTVSGSGWTPGDAIFVQIGSTTFDNDVVCALTANLDGQILGNQSTNSCTVPNVPAGSRTLFAIDESHMATTATGANFTVDPGLVLTPAGAGAGGPASPGTSVTVEGHGFAASTTVSKFELDGVALAATPSSVTTDTQGNFTAAVTFTVPTATTAANHTVSASDTASHKGSATIRIYRPTVAVSPTAGSPGTGLTVSGSGWPVHDSVFVQIGSSTFDVDTACAVTARPDGQISADQASNNCVIPDVPAGTRMLVGIDEQNQGVHATGANFTVDPGLVLTPASGVAGGPASPGASVTVEGHGFAASTTVSKFKLDGVALSTTPSSITTDTQGNFTAPVTFKVPTATSAANHTVSATDTASHTGSATIRTYRPTVAVSPTAGTPGTGLTVSGSGWPAGDSVFVQIGSGTFDNDTACAVAASPDGQISADQVSDNCVIPDVPAGTRMLVGIDEQNQGVQATGANFTVDPGLVLTTAEVVPGGPASPGASVTIEGHGFAASTTVSKFELDGAALSTTPSSITTDTQGNFTAAVTFTVPTATTAANHTVSAADTASHKGSATIRIYRPTVAVSPTSGSPGTGLTVSGSGWPAGDTIFVQIGSTSFDSDVVCAITANLNGQILANKTTNSCAVPSVGTGSQVLFAIDEQNQGVIAKGSNFTVTAVRTTPRRVHADLRPRARGTTPARAPGRSRVRRR